MAAGSVVVYQRALYWINTSVIDLNSATVQVLLVSAGYTPAPATHSTTADIGTNEMTTAGYARVTYTPTGGAGAGLDEQSNSHVRFDIPNTVLSATSIMSAKYAIVCTQTSGRLLAYFDLNDGGGELAATQISINWASDGVFRYSNPN